MKSRFRPPRRTAQTSITVAVIKSDSVVADNVGFEFRHEVVDPKCWRSSPKLYGLLEGNFNPVIVDRVFDLRRFWER